MMKLAIVVGARPNFMKITPILKAINRYNAVSRSTFHTLLIHTGQHYDYEMSKIFFEDLDIPEPHIYLGIGSGTHGEQTGKMLIALERVFMEQQPNLVMVVGDVNSTLAGALAAAKLHIPVAHVEAGLRCFDMQMPEELNRILTDRVAELLFTPVREANYNLIREGVPEYKIFLVGDVMIDVLIENLGKARNRKIYNRMGLEHLQYGVVTLHRAENVDNPDRLYSVLDALNEIGKDIPLIFPIHPRTRKRIEEFGFTNMISEWPDNRIKQPALYAMKPIGYLDFISLEMHTTIVFTDSGGIQKETMMLNIPCLTLRNRTEYPFTLTRGTNTLVGTDKQLIIHEAHKVLTGNRKHADTIPLWDGKAATRIVDVIANWYGMN